MPTPRKPTAPTTAAIDQFCARFDDQFARYEERTALRQYLIGLLLPREHNKTLVELAAIVPRAPAGAAPLPARCALGRRGAQPAAAAAVAGASGAGPACGWRPDRR